MIAARWVLRAAQGGKKMTVSNASKQIEVGERGVYHAINVIQNGIPEEISDCDSAKRAEGTPGAIRCRPGTPSSNRRRTPRRF